MDVHYHAYEISGHFPVVLYNQLLTLNNQLLDGDAAAPTASMRESFAALGGRVDAQVARLRALEQGEIAAFNRMLRELDVPAVTTTTIRK
jgi:hypothetical protein